MQASGEGIIDLPKLKISSIIKDAVKCAEAVNLVYVSNTLPGITRMKKSKNFSYYYQEKKVTDTETLKRIKSLVIPQPGKMYGSARFRTGIYRPLELI